EVEILYNTSEGHKKIAIAIAAMWRQALGVRTRMVNREWKVYLNSRQQGQFQIARAGWIGDYNDANTFAELMLSDSGINDAGFANADYDRLVRRAALTPDPAERAGLLQNAERVLLEVLPVLPIFFYVSQSLVKPYVLGWEPNILDHHPTRHLAVGKR
ncbi:MAG: ABC transporter substrate-binding protein, partial [SAR324 cluster bacterium]|nr:ABC transporter substrate-binding protein [SAR324 cluster bacterium]